MKINKIILIIFVLVMLVSLCMSVYAEQNIKIGISLGTLKEERWAREARMFEQYGKEHGIEVLVLSAEDDASRQITQCESFITQGVDVLIVSALDSEGAGVIVEPAHKAGIPVLSYERLVRNGDIDYHVGFDAYKVGVLQATALVERAPKGNYVWIKGGPEEFLAHLYYAGNKEIFTPFIERGDITIVLEQWCPGWNPEHALKHTENALSMTNNNIQAVLAPNDNTAGAAITALAAQGLAGKVPVSGQDADLSACQRIVEGTQAMTAYKPLIKLNTAAMQIATALAKKVNVNEILDQELGVWNKWDNGYKEADVFLVDVTSVDKDNIVDTVIADKFYLVKDVYKNIPKDQWPEQP